MWGSKKKEPKERKEKAYQFSTTEIIASGDKYEYTVQAYSREEAFKKLVDWFYGEKGHAKHDDAVKQQSFQVTMPQNDRFETSGMPWWFGRMISSSGSRSTFAEARKRLANYLIENNIKEDKR